MFQTDEEYRAARFRNSVEAARRREEEKTDVAFMIVMALVMVVTFGGLFVLIAYQIAGLEGVAWLFGAPLALFALGFEIRKRLP